MKQRTKFRLFLLVPAMVVLGLVYHLSSPQYAFKQFMTALESHDIETAKSFCTSKFLALDKSTYGELISNTHWSKFQNCRSVVWKRPDSTHAEVACDKGVDGYCHYFLLKTPQGWKLDNHDGGLF